MQDYNITSKYVKPIGTKVKVPDDYGKDSLIGPFVQGRTGEIVGYGQTGHPKPKNVDQITMVKVRFDKYSSWINLWSCFDWELEYPCHEQEQP